MPSANAIWTHGKHTITFGGSFSYTQLNTRDERPNKGMIGFADFSQFAKAWSPPTRRMVSSPPPFLQGNANRYYRVQRNWRIHAG